MKSPINFTVNQFNQSTDKIIDSIVGEVVEPTVSLCHVCHSHIPAYTYKKDNQLWMAKSCKFHGITHHMLERDYEFWNRQVYTVKKFSFTFRNIITEITDRCNLECPHCYHLPDNKIIDEPIDSIIARIENWGLEDVDINFAGAEPTLRKDFPELLSRIKNRWPTYSLGSLTNGIRFANKEWVKECHEAGLDNLILGLNHPSYLNNLTIRTKQIEAIDNCVDAGIWVYSIGYTMSSISELRDILEEITSVYWKPNHFRIRYGVDIGRYPDQQKMFASDTYKEIKKWCEEKGISFSDEEGDNNLHHVMVNVGGKSVRIIQWCDETDINMEELRTGPYCDFVSDGLTNFLHQVIRRDVSKNQGIILPDTPPERYLMKNQFDNTPLDFKDLK